jgi:hypothetical protein
MRSVSVYGPETPGSRQSSSGTVRPGSAGSSRTNRGVPQFSAVVRSPQKSAKCSPRSQVQILPPLQEKHQVGAPFSRLVGRGFGVHVSRLSADAALTAGSTHGLTRTWANVGEGQRRRRTTRPATQRSPCALTSRGNSASEALVKPCTLPLLAGRGHLLAECMRCVASEAGAISAGGFVQREARGVNESGLASGVEASVVGCQAVVCLDEGRSVPGEEAAVDQFGRCDRERFGTVAGVEDVRLVG